MNEDGKRTSDVLRELLNSCGEGNISLGEFVSSLGDRAFGLAILIFALPNSLPIPGIPGFSTLTGLPVIFFAMQLLLGRDTIWLPEKIAKTEFSQVVMVKVLSKALPAVVWLEKYLHPRWLFMSHPVAERLQGLLFIVLAGIIALPIPLGNFLPGLSMTLLALGLLEKDGALISFGTVFALGSIIFMSTVIVLFFTTLFSWLAGFI